MNIVSGDLLIVNGEKFITLDVALYNDTSYAFVNKLTDTEESTNEFYTFQVLSNQISTVENKEILDKLLPQFSKNVQNLINKISSSNVWR